MREVLPELLDSLPHDDPTALRSRAELRLINRLMGNHHWLLRTLHKHSLKGKRILELGAGDGTLAHRAWQDRRVQPAQWSALDLAPAPSDWPSGAAWHQGDLFAQPMLPEADIIIANLFLHHFQDDQLAALSQRLPDRCRLIIACEPARRPLHTLQGRLLSALVRLSHVTHHDMLISIRAGFIGDELATALKLHGWQTLVSLTALGAYRFTAWR